MSEEKFTIAQQFASIGGKAGKGASKRRSADHYKNAGKKGALKRWKNHKKKTSK